MNCVAFIVHSFAVRDAAHLRHLSASTYAHHMALGDFYEALTGLIDQYAEVYMGIEGQVKKWPAAEVPTDGPIELLEDFLEVVQGEAKEDAESQALLNILAEMEALTAQTLYKLRHLK